MTELSDLVAVELIAEAVGLLTELLQRGDLLLEAGSASLIATSYAATS
jgi:hypothetical protein